jgi:hypothetical protein
LRVEILQRLDQHVMDHALEHARVDHIVDRIESKIDAIHAWQIETRQHLAVQAYRDAWLNRLLILGLGIVASIITAIVLREL